MKMAQLGPLRARITGGTDRDGGGEGPVVVLLHGFGAPGDDLVPLWRVLDVPAETRFVFPEAPLELDYGGRAWWLIDFERLERAMRGLDPSDRTVEVPEGLVEARAAVMGLVDEIERTMKPPSLVLGGFSQGAMLSLDVALHRAATPAGVIQMSGTLIARDEWTPLLPARRGMRVLQSHGREDPLLPFAIAERLRDLLVAGGVSVEFIPFRGGHQIPENVLEAASAFIRDVTRAG